MIFFLTFSKEIEKKTSKTQGCGFQIEQNDGSLSARKQGHQRDGQQRRRRPEKSLQS